LLYVQPYYAQSTSGNAFPLLQRVGVMFGNRVGIGNTLADALSNATPVTTTPGTPGGPTTPSTPPSTPTSTSSTPTSTPSGGTSNETLAQAVAALSQAQSDAAAALRRQPVDWTAFGDAQARIQRETDVLKRLASSLPSPSASRSG
jgi:uncharacterized membrane protein (UPF0182 family)